MTNSVKAHGGKCDDIKDDTKAVQETFDDWASYPEGGPVEIPGTCKITEPILLKTTASSGLMVTGLGRLTSRLKQYTDNAPIIQTLVEDIHSVTMCDLGLLWNNKQTTAHPNSYAISFNGKAGIGDGWYYWNLARLRVTGSHTGIGIQGTGQLPVWGQVWDDIHFQGCAGQVIRLVSPTPAGMPRNQWRKISHLNGSPTGNAVAIEIDSAEVTCDDLDLEDWGRTQLVYVSGNAQATVRGIHIERWTGSNNGKAFNSSSSESAQFSDIYVHGTPDALAGIHLFNVDNAIARMTVERVSSEAVIANPSGWQTFKAQAAGGKFWARDVRAIGIGTQVSIYPPAFDQVSQAAMAQYVN